MLNYDVSFDAEMVGGYHAYPKENGVVTSKAINEAVNTELENFFAIEGTTTDNFEVVIRLHEDCDGSDPLNDPNEFTVGVKGIRKINR